MLCTHLPTLYPVLYVCSSLLDKSVSFRIRNDLSSLEFDSAEQVLGLYAVLETAEGKVLLL